VSTYDERLTAVEQTITSLRQDFLQAIMDHTRSMTTLNKVVLQQEQNMRDADHEITILTGVISAQGRDIKEMKNRLESFDQRFTSLEERFDQRFTSSEEKFDQRFASLEGKLEQVVQLLTTPPGTDK
jgi:chromosome segregation ATPase